jgi:hypothetical protein
LSSKIVFITQIDYTDSTAFSSDGLKLTIDSLTFDVDSKQTADSITEIVTRPHLAERTRREKIISSADASILNFLLERAKVIEDLDRLKLNPREAIMLKLDNISKGEDPLSLYKKRLTDNLSSPFNSMDSDLLLLKPMIGDAMMKRVYAMIYGIAAVQTAILKGSDPAKPLSLLEKVADKKLSAQSLSVSSITDETKKLYAEASIMVPKILLT